MEDGILQKIQEHRGMESLLTQKLAKNPLNMQMNLSRKIRELLFGTTWKEKAIRVGAFAAVATLAGLSAYTARLRLLKERKQMQEREGAAQQWQVMEAPAEPVTEELRRAEEIEVRRKVEEGNQRILQLKQISGLDSAQKLRERYEIITQIKELNLQELALKGDWLQNYDTSEEYNILLDKYCNISKYNEKYSARIWACVELDEDFDSISKLLPKITWLHDIEVDIRGTRDKQLRHKHVEMTKQLLQNNKKTLKILRLSSTRGRCYQWSEAVRDLDMFLDFCLEGDNMKNLQTVEFNWHLQGLLEDVMRYGNELYKGDNKVALDSAMKKVHEFAIRMIRSERSDITNLNSIKESLHKFDDIRYEEEKRQGKEIKTGYIKMLWIAERYAAAKKRMISGLQKLKQNEKNLEENKRIAKLFRKEIVSEMMQQACGVSKFQQFDFRLLHGFAGVYQRADGLSVGDCCTRYWQKYHSELFEDALEKCRGVSECCYDVNKISVYYMESMEVFLKNNADSLQKLQFYVKNEVCRMDLFEAIERIQVLPRLTEFGIDTKTISHENAQIAYNFVERNKNVCIFSGIENIESEEIRQKIEALLMERQVVRLSAVD